MKKTTKSARAKKTQVPFFAQLLTRQESQAVVAGKEQATLKFPSDRDETSLFTDRF